MSMVKGAISITDNATAVLKSIKQEQSAFRNDVTKTRKELTSTWDKKYTARLEATAAAKKAKELTSKLEPLRKKVVTAVAIKDNATAKVKNIANQVKATGKMVAKPIVNVVVKGANALSSLGASIAKIGKTAAIGLGAAATVAAAPVITGAISEGAGLEQSIGGVETLFKGDAGVVKANADAAFKTAGLSANDYMEQVTSFSASLLGSLGGDTAKAAQVADMAMIDMADNANKFGSDMSSIQSAYQGFAKQNYTMLDNLKLGYGGTQSEMKRLLKDASKLTGVKYNISNLSDVYSAINAVQTELGVTGTTAKEAGETFSGSFAAMKASAKNLLGNMAIGGDVTGSMEQLVESASTFLFNNALPMIGRVISSFPKAITTGLKKVAPKIKESGKAIVGNLKAGIVSILPSSMGSVASQLFDSIGNLGNGFKALLPHLTTFGTNVMSTVQRVSAAVMPAIVSIITTVQNVIPAVLPVLGTVISAIGTVISQAAPIIAGMVSGIGTVITTLAPIFQTIFTEIGDKVGSVIGFVSERMGFVSEVFETVAPLLGDILTTAWGVISPIMDIAVSTFELIFAVVQKVFPGIKSVIESVWDAIKPLFEAIGSGLEKLASGWDWIVSKVTGVSAKSGTGTAVGQNAAGDNNWRGGLTWVGEDGAELVDLPKGSRILPHKESVSLASTSRSGSAMSSTGEGIGRVAKSVIVGSQAADNGGIVLLQRIEKNVEFIATSLFGSRSAERLMAPGVQPGGVAERLANSISVTIAKIADTIIIREEADIDKLTTQMAAKVAAVAANMI